MTDQLGGIKVVVTRPIHQQAAFTQMLETAGAQAISLPCIDIVPIGQQARDDLIRLKPPDILIFTSVNAVECANQALPMPWNMSGTNVLAIGQSTARRLRQVGMPVSHCPVKPFNSEALLLLIDEKMNNLQNVAIVKGDGGRTLIRASMLKRSKTVEFINVYTRKLPAYDGETVNSVFLNSEPDIVSITSNESLRNLVLLAGDRFAESLKFLPLTVNSERCAQLAKVLGFKSRVLVAQTPGDQGQIEAIHNWNRSYRFKL